MKTLILTMMLLSTVVKAEETAFVCSYGKTGEVISSEDFKKGQTTFTKSYQWDDNLTVKVTIFDLTKRNTSGTVVEVANGKEREFPAICIIGLK
jgi:hypothetical protein